MVGSGRYLKMTIGEGDYLLPSDVALSIENRDRIRTVEAGQSTSTGLVGRYNVGNMNWPAYLFESETLTENDWTHAVFLKTAPRPVGMVAKDVVMLSQERAVRLQPFTVVGNLLEGKPLFSNFWMSADGLALVFDPQRVSDYFTKLDERYGHH